MVRRGAKPKNTHLRLVTGAHRTTRHGNEATAKKKAETAAAAFGKLQQPKGLKAKAAAAWRRYIAPAGWLDGSKEPAAIAFCELWSEFMTCPTMFASAKHSQLRAYMNELGLTDERNRSDAEGEEDKDEFFKD